MAIGQVGFIVHLDNYVHHCQITFLSHVTPKIHSFPFELAIFFQSFPWPSFSSIGIHLTTMFTFSNTLFRQFYMFLALPVMNLAASKFIFQIYSYSLTPGPNPQIFYSLLAIWMCAPTGTLIQHFQTQVCHLYASKQGVGSGVYTSLPGLQQHLSNWFLCWGVHLPSTNLSPRLWSYTWPEWSDLSSSPSLAPWHS